MFSTKCVDDSRRPRIAPHNFIHKILLPEHLIHDSLDIVSHVPIDVHVYASSLGQQFAHQHQPWVEHFQVGDSAVSPSVGVGKLLDDGRTLLQIHARQADFGAIVRLAVKRRVYINQVHLAPQRRQPRRLVSRQHGLHGEQVVAVDETVDPSVAYCLAVLPAPQACAVP